jgi:hypothetical protein
MNEMLLLDTRPLAYRSPLAISIMMHVALLWLFTLVQGNPTGVRPVSETYKRSVIVLNFRDLPRRVSKPAGSVGQIAGFHSPVPGSQSDSRKTRTAPDLAAIADSGASNNRPHPSFELPQNFRVHPVKQTLLQPDVPPDVLLKHEVPLPNVVFWTSEAPTPFRKRFVAPPVKAVAVKVTQRV